MDHLMSWAREHAEKTGHTTRQSLTAPDRCLDCSAKSPAYDLPKVDLLPPSQYLMMEVLAARARRGSGAWTFPRKAAITTALVALTEHGWAGWKYGVVQDTVLAWPTETGLAAFQAPDFDPAGQPVWVVSPVDAGIDGLAPSRVYGDDIGPFPTFEQAEAHRQALEGAAREQGNFYARWTVREVTHQVVRWER